MVTVLAINMETGDLADYEPREKFVTRDVATVGNLEVIIPQSEINSERIERLEQRIEKLWDTVIDCAEHIEKLENLMGRHNDTP